MPNWCKGNLRLRGKREAIIDFVTNELVYTGYPNGILGETETGPLHIEDDGYEMIASIPEEKKNMAFAAIYIKNTHRNFIERDAVEVYGDDDKFTVSIDGFKAAWHAEAEPYLEKARKYGLDIKIVAFDKGMQFMQVLVIENGEIVEDCDIEFDNWYWECLMPNMGG